MVGNKRIVTQVRRQITATFVRLQFTIGKLAFYAYIARKAVAFTRVLIELSAMQAFYIIQTGSIDQTHRQ